MDLGLSFADIEQIRIRHRIAISTPDMQATLAAYLQAYVSTSAKLSDIRAIVATYY